VIARYIELYLFIRKYYLVAPKSGRNGRLCGDYFLGAKDGDAPPFRVRVSGVIRTL
jgi:hypothetical protein